MLLSSVILASVFSLTRQDSGIGYPDPTFVLDSSVLRVHNAYIAYFDSRRGIDLDRGIPLMEMESLAIPFHPGADLVWTLDPGTYTIRGSSLTIDGHESERQSFVWTIVVPALSRAERVSGLVAQIIDARAELRSLGVSESEVWDAMEGVVLD